MRTLIVTLGILVMLATPALAATSASIDGNVRGLNTVDNVLSNLHPGTYSYDLTATGNGNNRLKFRVYVWDHSIDDWRWQRVHTARLSASNNGATLSGTFTIGAEPGETGTRRVKFVFSRKVGTSRINYELEANRQ
ncbi:MAG: hypothetical protein QNJ98_08760 [Planctomycetota bacterium]|nr:hypothetical protein [Planctomycetota bacterium]